MDNVEKHPKGRSRRRFVLGSLGVAGALVVGWSVLPPRQRLHAARPDGSPAGSFALNGWITIDQSSRVVVMLPKSEMGQGITTALAMLVAEELDVPVSQLDFRQAPLHPIFGDTTMVPDGLPFRPDDHGVVARGAQWVTRKLMRELGVVVTGGSSSVKDAWMPMRAAGAAARARLVAAAAQVWQAPVEQCRTQHGRVVHTDGRSLSYGELASRAAAMDDVPFAFTPPRNFRVIGQAVERLDTPAKVNGSAQFGMDIRLPGLRYATVVMPPRVGAILADHDPASLGELRSSVRLVRLRADRSGAPDALAIVAQSRWTSLKALEKLAVTWRDSEPWSSSQPVHDALRKALESESSFTFYRRGDVERVDATKSISAEYAAPYLAHAALEPVNCTAQLKDGRLALWVPTQAPSIAVAVAARAAGIDKSLIDLHVTQLGGGFGRRLDCDMVAQVAAIARELGGAPVQLMWTREQDFRHDFYRPASIARLSAKLDAAGKVSALTTASASGAPVQQLIHRAFGLPPAGPDKTTIEGLFDHPYEIPNQHIAHVKVDSPLPLGSWRSVGHSHNAFFKESFVDELAAALSIDPVVFRRQLLAGQPRHRAVLEAAVKLAGDAPPGHALGVALHESFGTIVAQVAQVSVVDKRIRVHRISCAVDCGTVVHPDGVRQQVESAICMGLSAALHERISTEGGQVQQSNFLEYRILRNWEMPEVAVELIASDEAPEGMGEPALPPVAPAVANAVFRLTGQRLRSLPLTLA